MELIHKLVRFLCKKNVVLSKNDGHGTWFLRELIKFLSDFSKVLDGRRPVQQKGKSKHHLRTKSGYNCTDKICGQNIGSISWELVN